MLKDKNKQKLRYIGLLLIAFIPHDGIMEGKYLFLSESGLAHCNPDSETDLKKPSPPLTQIYR